MDGVSLWMPGVWVRRLCRPPVSAADVNALLTGTSDELERAFLRLTADVLRQPVAPEAVARVRAEALGRSADAVLRSQMLTRRASALREETMAQIEFPRQGLASLADAVRSVATESLSAADARAEMEAWLPGGAVSEPVLRLRAEDGF